MSDRINILKNEPEAYKAMKTLENYIATSKVTPIQKELIKIRASQINGCAYCINMHARDARKIGETEQRIYLLNAWRETSLFTEEEKAILALTEEVTLIAKGVSDDIYQQAANGTTASGAIDVVFAVGVNKVGHKGLASRRSVIPGSNCVPRHRINSALTWVSLNGPRYGRSVVIASIVSANRMIRAAIGIESPPMRSG